MQYNVAFSSSGIRFAAHVGVLAYLQDKKIDVKNFAGTSGGAIVATWGANNLPARELLNLTLQFGYPKFLVKPSFKLGGMWDHSVFGDIVSTYCKPKNNLWVVTFNVLKMQKEIWNGEKYNLAKILTATTCIPGLFKPVVYSNGLHIDGIFARFCPDDLWDFGTTLSIKLISNLKTRKLNTKSRYLLDKFVQRIEQATIDFLEGTQAREQKSNIVNISPDVNLISQIDLFAVNAEDHMKLFKSGYEAAEQAVGASCEQFLPMCV